MRYLNEMAMSLFCLTDFKPSLSESKSQNVVRACVYACAHVCMCIAIILILQISAAHSGALWLPWHPLAGRVQALGDDVCNNICRHDGTTAAARAKHNDDYVKSTQVSCDAKRREREIRCILKITIISDLTYCLEWKISIKVSQAWNDIQPLYSRPVVCIRPRQCNYHVIT